MGWKESRRDKIIMYAILNNLSLTKTQLLLKSVDEALLYSRFRRDSIFIWGIVHEQKLSTINDLCIKYGCSPLY